MYVCLFGKKRDRLPRMGADVSGKWRQLHKVFMPPSDVILTGYFSRCPCMSQISSPEYCFQLSQARAFTLWTHFKEEGVCKISSTHAKCSAPCAISDYSTDYYHSASAWWGKKVLAAFHTRYNKPFRARLSFYSVCFKIPKVLNMHQLCQLQNPWQRFAISAEVCICH